MTEHEQTCVSQTVSRDPIALYQSNYSTLATSLSLSL